MDEIMETRKKKTSSNWPQYLAVISATIVSTTAGISFAWPSPSVPKLLSDEFPLNITPSVASYIAITAPIGGIVGGPISAYLVDIIGRKQTLLLVALPQSLALLATYFAPYSLIYIYLGRFLSGVGEGVNFTVMAIYVGEIACPSIRGHLGSYISLTLRLGILLVNVVGSYMSIPNASLVFLSLPILFLCSFIWMPETPYYLLMKGRKDLARRSLVVLRRTNDVDKELDDLSRDVARQLSESGRLVELWRNETNRRALLIALGLRTFQQFSGISAFTQYTQVMFESALDGFSPVLASIIYSAIQLLITCTSAVVVDVAGRRPLLVYSGVGCCVILSTATLYFILRDFTSVDVGSVVGWWPLFAMIVFIVIFPLGLGTLVNIMLAELFSASVKPKALCILNVYFALLMCLTTKCFQLLNDSIGLSVPFAIFSFCCLLGVLFAKYYVPETKGKTLEEIQQNLRL